jgi:7,8-dihydro-6-hydroxymethylpterin-pyrophosphokinase
VHARRLDEINRALFHLVIDTAEVFAEHADRDKLHAAEKQHKRGERGEASRRRLDLDEVLFEERIVLPPVTSLPTP